MARGVIALPGLWIDIDIQGPAHAAENLPVSLDEAEDFAREFPLQPTSIVDTGHGMHVYWLFKELLTWDQKDNGACAAAQKLVRDFQATLQAMAELRGWRVDTTSDLSRVLRVPGTTNWKLQNEPALVRILDIQESCRYAPAGFEPYLIRPQHAQPGNNGAHSTRTGRGDYRTLDIVALFKTHRLYGDDLGEGKHAVMCPWDCEHTEERPAGDSDTVIWEASDHQLWPQFCCLHGHCFQKRGIAQVIEKMVDADEFCS